MQREVTKVLAVIVLSCIPAVCWAQEFSADVVYLAPSKAATSGSKAVSLHQPSKLYVSKSKMRLETRGITGTVLVVNSENHSTVALFPDQKAFQPLGLAPSEYFHVQDPENACPDWQKASELKISCEKVGPETVDGRQTVKYENKSASPAAPVSTVWIDPALNFVVKWEGKDSAAELRNVKKEDGLSAALFEVPRDYELMKPKKKGPKAPKK